MTALLASGSGVSALPQGQVLSSVKISDTAGGFTAILEEQDQFGRAVVSIGDLDGDGITDLAVGAQGDDDGAGGLDRGAVYILFLKASGAVRTFAKISDTSGGFSGFLEPNDQFGRAIGYLGDVDGDGVGDIAVGANFDDDGGTHRGACYVLFLNADGTVKANQKISDIAGFFSAPLINFDEFGRAIAGLGDLDGDGVPDMAVAAPYDDDGGQNAGAIYVIFLNSNGTAKTYQKISEFSGGLGVNLASGDLFGHSIAPLGDFDNDGVQDLVVGGVLDDDGGLNRGSVYIVTLNSNGTVKATHKISDLAGNFDAVIDDIDQFGVSVATLGDLDADGVIDIAVGAVKDDDGGSMTSADVGATYVILMNANGTVKQWQKLSATAGGLKFPLDLGDWFGCALGFYDGGPSGPPFQLAVGSRFDDDGGGNHGAIYLLELNTTTFVPPTASFVASTTSGPAPLEVMFADLSTGDVTSWAWNFQDGPVSNLPNPVHIFNDPGVYSVTLVVGSPIANDQQRRNGYVVVTEPPPTALFTVSPTTGEAPLATTFSDSSTLNITSWAWDFGDGTTSSAASPSHVYMSAGTYAVSLTVQSAGGADVRTVLDQVTVAEPAPQAAFLTGTTSGEAPLAVTFTDTSTLAITSWVWDFGDGSSSTVQSPVHTYTTAGTFAVSLTVTSAGGTDSTTVIDLVTTTEPLPVAAVSLSTTAGVAPLPVVFTDQSTLNITSWAWDFGDGSTSTLQSPTHVYPAVGTYSASLTVTSSAGTDTLALPPILVSEPAPQALFTLDVSSGNPPLEVSFTDQSTLNVTGWAWDFGDGATSTLASPSHSFATVGTYTVSLSVTSAGGSDNLTLTDVVVVTEPAPVAAFATSTVGGEAPLPVTFLDASTLNITAWAWDFGDGETSSLASPTHTYGVSGTFTVSLTVSSAGGADTETLTDLVTVTEPLPVADFTRSTSGGDAPLSVAFSDASTLNITAWAWDFGDGTTSTLASPVHTFANVGTYTVTLSVTSVGGTDSLIHPEPIVVAEPVPTAAFGTTSNTGPAPLTVGFSDASTLNVTAWAWDFGDGQTSSLQNPSHTFADVGPYTVSLTATSAGGTNTLALVDHIVVTEPVPAPAFSSDQVAGLAPLVVSFTDASTLNITGWAWDFGDGGTSTLQHPTHEYRTAGLFTVQLTATSAGGSVTLVETDLIAVSEPLPVAAFTPSSMAGDAPLAVTFADASTLNITSWAWDFGDGTTSTLAAPAHVFSSVGTYTVSLTVTSAGGADTTTRTITAEEPLPVAAFGMDVTSGDPPLAVTFTDASTLNITGWAWDFGDGSTSSAASPTHSFETVGTFTVSLVVTSAAGTNSTSEVIVVTEPAPVAAFAISENPAEFAPATVSFTDSSTLNITAWAWDFGDGESSTLEHPAHLFAASGDYTVSLTVSSPGGSDTTSTLLVVIEPAPVAAFTQGVTTGEVPLAVSFSDQSTLAISSWLWDFGDGRTSTSASPTHVYSSAGTFDVSLSVTSAGGADTVTATGLVVVTEPVPVASFLAAPTTGDHPLTVSFTDSSTMNITSWAWDFGDGGAASVQNPSHTYTAVGTYTVTLTVSSSGGTDTETMLDLIVVEEPPPVAEFSATSTSGQAPFTTTFTDATSGLVSGWAWDFGDGGTSTLQDPSHTFVDVGTYTVALTAVGSGGENTTSKVGYIVVTEPPPVAAFTPSLTAGEAPLSVSFADASTLNITGWFWDFGDGSTSATALPTHVYMLPGSYTVSLVVTSAGGTDAIVFPDPIVVVEPAPTADFSATPTAGDAPLAVAFADASLLNVTAWSWSFGDGQTSTAASPTHVDSTPGTYDVALTVTSAGGTDTLTRPAHVVVADPAPIVAFDASPRTGFPPLDVTFTDATLHDVTAWAWDFGDGTTSALQNPTHRFTEVGSYTVTLAATGQGGMSQRAEVDFIVVAEPAPAASFVATSDTVGVAPLPVSFSDTSSLNVTAWSWDFGDGGTSTLEEPTHLFETVGTHSVTLTVTSAGGTDSTTALDLVVVGEPAPSADFTPSSTTGPAPLVVAFTDTSTLNITSWAWDFGDGTTSTLAEPTHVYGAVGTYSVSLTVTSAAGTDALLRSDYVVVVEPAPTALFTFEPPVATAPVDLTFLDASVLNVTAWEWLAPDGQTSTQPNPVFSFPLAGTFDVSLTVTSAGGSDTLTQQVVVTEPPPVAIFDLTPLEGDAPLVVQFTDRSTLTPTAWTWDFGDGESSTQQHPAHLYANPGTYTASLLVTSAGGTDSTTTTLVVREPVPTAAFVPAVTTGIAPLSVTFTDGSALNVTAWSWDFGDGGTSTAQDPSHVYATVGTYTVALTVTSAGGTDTRTELDLIVVQEPPPVAAFSLTPSAGEAPLPVAFTDASVGAISAWSWDFGDGESSTLQHPSHVYQGAGTFTVTLSVTSAGGTDTSADSVVVTEPAPVASFTTMTARGGVPLSVTFTDTSTLNITSWSWDFGDGETSALQHPVHLYQETGTYGVSLTVTSAGGTDTRVEPSLIEVLEPAPVAGFTAAPTSGNAPLSVVFFDSTTQSVTSWSWDFGDGGTSSLRNPIHVFTSGGTYSVSLTATGPGGSSTLTRPDLIVVAIPPPVANFSATPFRGFSPLTCQFNDLSTGVVTAWAWDFGDGQVSTLQEPSHLFEDPGDYTVALTASGPGGSHFERKIGYVQVVAPPVFHDGSFEEQTAGLRPMTPWRNRQGTNAGINPQGAERDNEMPTHGTKWLEVSASGTVGAVPPSNPGGEGTQPVGAATVLQDFSFDPANPFMAFRASFILEGPAASEDFNDFMSVDVTDGTVTQNLYYADTFSEFPLLSDKYGLPMTRVATVVRNLAALFPTATATTRLTLGISLGNVGDGLNHAKGYVDEFVLGHGATAMVHNGSGINRLCHAADPPRIGGSWTASVDTSQHPGAALSYIFAFQLPGSGALLGPGELLVDPNSPPLFSLPLSATGGVDSRTLPIPNEISLIGALGTTQGLIFGGGMEFCNAVNLILGF